MNAIRKTVAALGLTVLALSALAAPPAGARAPGFVRHSQVRHAASLDRKAAHAAFTGNYRRASRLRHQAARVRSAARHGY